MWQRYFTEYPDLEDAFETVLGKKITREEDTKLDDKGLEEFEEYVQRLKSRRVNFNRRISGAEAAMFFDYKSKKFKDLYDKLKRRSFKIF